jgi:hypothetical protein
MGMSSVIAYVIQNDIIVVQLWLDYSHVLTDLTDGYINSVKRKKSRFCACVQQIIFFKP